MLWPEVSFQVVHSSRWELTGSLCYNIHFHEKKFSHMYKTTASILKAWVLFFKTESL